MADGRRFVIERRWVYASSCYGSLTIPCTKLLKNVGRVGESGGESGEGRYPLQLNFSLYWSLACAYSDNFRSNLYFYTRFFAAF